jgi:hypothetical protein
MIGRVYGTLLLGAAILVAAPLAACAQPAPSDHSAPTAPEGGLPLPSLPVEGNRFVDESGRTVVLRGVAFPDPDRLERAGKWNRAYFEAARSRNANLVRFPVHPQRWRERGEEDYLRLLDEGIRRAGELGMYVIIDFFERKGISWTAWVFDPQWSPQLIQGWDFGPTRQGRFFRDRMMQLNPRSR